MPPRSDPGDHSPRRLTASGLLPASVPPHGPIGAPVTTRAARVTRAAATARIRVSAILTALWYANPAAHHASFTGMRALVGLGRVHWRVTVAAGPLLRLPTRTDRGGVGRFRSNGCSVVC